jgi:hypothetical protein
MALEGVKVLKWHFAKFKVLRWHGTNFPLVSKHNLVIKYRVALIQKKVQYHL